MKKEKLKSLEKKARKSIRKEVENKLEEGIRSVLERDGWKVEKVDKQIQKAANLIAKKLAENVTISKSDLEKKLEKKEEEKSGNLQPVTESGSDILPAGLVTSGLSDAEEVKPVKPATTTRKRQTGTVPKRAPRAKAVVKKSTVAEADGAPVAKDGQEVANPAEG